MGSPSERRGSMTCPPTFFSLAPAAGLTAGSSRPPACSQEIAFSTSGAARATSRACWRRRSVRRALSWASTRRPRITESASRKARRLANCKFETGAAETLAFPESSFDVVVSSLMMHHIPSELRLQAVREMRRVLRPGGVLLLSDFSIPERGGWHLVGSITGHSGDKWRRRMTPLESLVAGADFTEMRSGDAPPWLHY